MTEREKAYLLLSMRMKDELRGSKHSPEDRKILNMLLDEINALHGTSFCTLAELASLRIPGAGKIVAKYISQFSSETLKMQLLDHMVSDKIENYGKILLQLYSDYKLKTVSMPQYRPDMETFYDNAFWRLQSKRIKNELAALLNNATDAYALPLTIRKVASWKMHGLRDSLIEYLELQDSAMGKELQKYDNFDFMCRQLRFSGLSCLKYYPSDEVIELLRKYSENDDTDVRHCAKKSLDYILKRISR